MFTFPHGGELLLQISIKPFLFTANACKCGSTCLHVYVCVCVRTLFILTTASPACGPSVIFNQKKTNFWQTLRCESVCIYACVCERVYIFHSLRSVHILTSMFPACIDQSLISCSPRWCLLSRCSRKISEGRANRRGRRRKRRKRERMRKEGGDPQDERVTCRAVLLHKRSSR